MPIPFDNSFSKLPKRFYTAQNPTPVAAPQLIALNTSLAAEMGLNVSDLDVAMLAGNHIPDGATPIATAYAGHQFGGFVPQLGDGRAVLLGEVVGPDSLRRDLQLKGAGRTMFSRGGDGRAAIGPVLREYIVSEAMHRLGIPTTRALAAVTTGEHVAREDMLPGAILTRVASSHIRVGTFQFHYARQDVEALQILADYVIARHYPDAANTENPILSLLENVVARQAELVAAWMHVGFIHGVMNTDNMAISGETIDYGPCAFMDGFHPATVFSSIDRQGRYAWNNQPRIAHWNLSELARTLLPLLGEDIAPVQTVLDTFDNLFKGAFYRGFGHKLGIETVLHADRSLIDNLLDLLATETVDFTLFFRNLTLSDTATRELFSDPSNFDIWIQQWHEYAPNRTLMCRTNPIYIPRNHRIEEIITAAENGNFAPFDTLMKVLANPYTSNSEYTEFEHPPRPEEIVHATFCGT